MNVTQQIAPSPLLRPHTRMVIGTVLATMLAGAFVAGNRAGLVYNEFPMMGGRFVPQDYWDLQPAWRNFTENLSAVQFNHRWLVCNVCACVYIDVVREYGLFLVLDMLSLKDYDIPHLH